MLWALIIFFFLWREAKTILTISSSDNVPYYSINRNVLLTGKEGVLRLHPDLAGRLAAAGALTRESTKEQSAAGLHLMTESERQKMSDLNEKYKQKFGFPFVICARENKKDAILQGLERRLQNSAESEAVTGVNEVKKICHLRLMDIVDENSVAKL